jgi:hypothetical protein
MTKQTIAKLSALISLSITLFSTIVALLSGGDLFFVIAVRFVFVLFASLVISWIALNAISSVIIKAAQNAINELQKEFEEEDRARMEAFVDESDGDSDGKGINVDFTSAPLDNEDLLDTPPAEDPKINEFEPFKPRRLNADTADSR